MIYCLPSNYYPRPEKVLEEIVYNDKNGLGWKLTRVSNGFFITHLSDLPSDKRFFKFNTKSGSFFLVKNTNCLFVESNHFEVFFMVRCHILKNQTNDIWDGFGRMLQERFKHDQRMLDSEFVN